MTKLEEIRARWARMQAHRYNLYRIESLPFEPLPWLCVASDRDGETDNPAITAITGPVSDPDSLEDAIAYAEAPTDVAYLLQLLTEASESLEWALDQLEEVGIANMAADKTAARLKGKEVE